MADDLFAPPAPKTARPHQVEALTRLRAALAKGHKRVCLSLATGAGKTFIASMIVRGALAKGNRVCFTVPALSLVDQTVKAFEAEGISHIGVIQGDHPRHDSFAPVQVASVQTLARRDRPAASVVIVDECHQKSGAVTRWMKEAPETVFIGLSATPGRQGMATEYDCLVVGATTSDLTKANVLSPFRTFAAASPDLRSVGTTAGDFHEGQLSEVMGGVRMVADVVATWLAKGEGRPTLCFAVDRAHARKLQADFEVAGVPCGYVDAHTDDVTRHHLSEQFRKGDLPVVVNVRCLTTGIDWDVRCIIMARPTKSTMLWVQMVGRGLRAASGKDDCLILDHSDNSLRLGFVSDIAFDRLAGGEVTKGCGAARLLASLPTKCPSCSYVRLAGIHACPTCGFKPERQSTVETVDGELVQIGGTKGRTPSLADRQRFWSMALSVDDERGKGGRLAKALYRARFGAWPNGLTHDRNQPDALFQAYEQSRRIAYVRARAKQEAATHAV